MLPVMVEVSEEVLNLHNGLSGTRRGGLIRGLLTSLSSSQFSGPSNVLVEQPSASASETRSNWSLAVEEESMQSTSPDDKLNASSCCATANSVPVSLFDRHSSSWTRCPSTTHRSVSEMDLNTRRQISDFEELIEKIDRLNDAGFDDNNHPRGIGQTIFHSEPRLHDVVSRGQQHVPHLSALLLERGDGADFSTRRVVADASAIDDDLENLLQEDPSILDAVECSNNNELNVTTDSQAFFNRNVPPPYGQTSVAKLYGVAKCSVTDQTAVSGLTMDMLYNSTGYASDVEISDEDKCAMLQSEHLTSPVPTRYFGPPTSLKSATMSTRTNLKQYLQMQQFHEQERKEQSKTPATFATNGSSSVSVPLQKILPSRMEVPSEVLKVHSRLENPTRYHVQENRKRQVQEYLSTTQGNARSILAQSVPNAGVTLAMAATGGTSAPLLSSSVPSPDSPNSMGLSSSAATSVTSEADVIESVMQLESSLDAEHKTFLPATISMTADNYVNVLKAPTVKSCPAVVLPDDGDVLYTDVQLHAIAKDRQKKDNHNMIERRRRFNINDRIKELGTLLPKSNDPYYDMIRVDRQNKGTILKATVDYVRHMIKETSRLKCELNKRDDENRNLRLQIMQLAALQSQSAGSSGVDVNWLESLTGSGAFMKHEMKVKEEPLDSSSDNMQSQLSPFDDLMDEDEPVHGDPMLSSSMLGNAL